MARTTGGRGRGRGAAAEEPPNEVQAEPRGRGRGRGRGAGAGRGRGSAGVDPPHEVEAEVPLRRSSREHVPARHRNDLLERIATRPAHARTSRSSDPHPRDRTSPSPSPPPQTAGSIGPAFPDNTENAPPQALRPSPPRPSRSPVPAYNVTQDRTFLVVAQFLDARPSFYLTAFSVVARVRVYMDGEPVHNSARSVPSIARLLAAEAAPRDTFQVILDECPAASIYSGTQILPVTFTYDDLHADSSSQSFFSQHYQRHGSMWEIQHGLCSGIPSLASSAADLAEFVALHGLPAATPVIALLVENDILPATLADAESLLSLAPQPDTTPPAAPEPFAAGELSRSGSPQRQPLEGSHPPASPVRESLSPTPPPAHATLKDALLQQYPQACRDIPFFLACSKGTKGDRPDPARPVVGSAYAAYSALLTLDTVAGSMGLSPQTPSRKQQVLLGGHTFVLTYYELAMAMGFQTGTLRNHKTKVGRLSTVLERVRRDPTPESRSLQDRLERLIAGPGEEPDPDIFVDWRLQDLVQAVRPYRTHAT